MKKASTLLLACTLALCSFAQQKDASTQTKSNTTEEQKQAYLSVIGGLSAAYVLTAQDHIDGHVSAFIADKTTADIANQKLSVQKSIIGVLRDENKKLETTNAIGPDSPDYSFLNDLNVVLDLMTKEIDLGIEYIKDKSAITKAKYDQASSQASKNIKALLGLE